MAKSLKIMIEMAGAEEIKRQLEGVGEAGEKAFHKIVDAAREAGGFNKLDPSVATAAMEEFGVKGSAAVDKVTQAVKSAGKMETLINALTGVENGLAKVQSAASAVDDVLGKSLVRSLTRIVRLLPAAFAAGVVGAIANTANELLKLDAAAIKFGASAQTISKLEGIFKAVGASASEASKGVETFFASMETAKIEAVTKAVADIKKELETGWFGWEGFKTLEKLAQGSGKAAKLARQALEDFGRKLPTDELEASIQKILTSTASAEDKFTQLMAIFLKMGDTAKRNALILDVFGDSLGTTIVQAINAGLTIEELNTLLGKIPPTSQAAIDAAIRLRLAWQQFKNLLVSGFEVSPQGLDAIAGALRTITGMLPTISAAIKTAFGGDILANTVREFQNLATVIGYINTGLTAVMGDPFANIKNEINTVINLLAALGQAGFQAMKFIELGAVTVWQTIIGLIDAAIERVKQFFGMGGGAAPASAGAMARGGIMGGRGTGTSDLNLAWLSRGEHIMPARAVRQPGVLQLLEALRRSGGNLRGVLDRMGHFADGRMVGLPAYAAGGAVGGMSHVTIAFPGLAPIGGLRASSAVVDELHRAAALAQVRSGGRKPSRYF